MAKIKYDKKGKIDPKFLKTFATICAKKAGNKSAICKALKISRETFYRHYNSDIDFKTVYDDACEELVDFAETQVITKVRDGSERMIMFYLTNKRPDDWAHRRTQTIEGSDKSPLHLLVEQKKQELNTKRKKDAAIKKAYKTLGIDKKPKTKKKSKAKAKPKKKKTVKK